MNKKENLEKRNLLVFGYGLAVILAFIGYRLLSGHGPKGLAYPLFAASIFLLFLTLFKVKMLKSFYVAWMKGAHFIGSVISTIILAVMFYGVFSPVGLLLRLMKKDYLSRDVDAEAQSYWVKRESAIDKAQYLKQY